GASSAVYYQWPTWDADGAHIYALRAEPGSARIERIDVATGEAQQIIDGAADFDVSRDGRLLAFVRSSDAGASLSLLRLESGQTQELVRVGPFQTITAPRFDRAGTNLLFSKSRPPNAGEEASGPDLIGPRIALAHGLPQD